uniref:Uncharacterized protein n=1 Tax=Trieres chinensis TaxID=1514140 RepID=A0A7S1ZKK4_TRICV|mmetsp:Transcript_27794/g.56973  ORF Transcript_27794/g.56973 Transcript_27794/m.56973 type:complete len:346 (+) Transcript_27794:63-1100(+)
MSFRVVTALNSPPLVAAAGLATLVGIPFVDAAATSGASLALLKGANVVSFAANCAAVSVPGRIDERQDQEMRRGALNPTKPAATGQIRGDSTPGEATPLADQEHHTSSYNENYSPARGRTLVSPSGWAFAIWGPIYAGEAIFVAAQLLPGSSGLTEIIPQVTAPFIATNIFQSLWCASFRPSYGTEGWEKYISPAMLAGTAYSLSLIHSVGTGIAGATAWYFFPFALHFGWTTAATLVNLSGSVSMGSSTPDSTVIAVGHSSAVVATAFGIGVTLSQSAPVYGLTVAWALAACGDGMKKRIAAVNADRNAGEEGVDLLRAAGVQKKLCWIGSGVCTLVALTTMFS